MSSRDSIVGQRIRKYRKEKGLTQKDFAQMIGKSESSVLKYEKGLVDIPFGVLENISSVLEVSIGDLGLWEEFDRKASPYLADEVAILDIASRIGGLTNEGISLFAQLNEDGQAKAIAYMQDLLKIESYCVPENEK